MVDRYSNLKEEVGGLIPSRDISSLLDIKLLRWSTISLCFGVGLTSFYLKKEKKKKEEEEEEEDDFRLSNYGFKKNVEYTSNQ